MSYCELKVEEQIRKGAEIIKKGGIVAFPTETVYGIGANAFDESAVKRIFELKNRPYDNPLIVHISNKDDVLLLASGLSEKSWRLIENFWPGPLTLVLPRNPSVPDIVSTGLPTIAVRMPSHPVALKLIDYAGLPIAAPSANPAGKPSPTKSEHVRMYFGDKVFVIEGETYLGIESTVIDMTSEPPIVLRPGGLEIEKIKSVIGNVIVSTIGVDELRPKSPGMKYVHYKPSSYMILLTGRAKVKDVKEHIEKRQDIKRLVFVMTYSDDERFKTYVLDLLSGYDIEFVFAGKDEREVAKNMFDILILKSRTCDAIVFEAVEERGIGLGVMNRLKKASDVII